MQQAPLFIEQNSTVSRLYRQHAPAILAYVRRLVSSWEDAEDIVLDTFLAALEQEERLSALSEQAQLAWLRRVAHNKVVDSYRQASRGPAPLFVAAAEQLTGEESTPEQAALQQEAATLLRARLADLSLMQQEVVRLRFEAGLRCTEIAVLLGKPEGTIRSLLSRALNILRQVYQEESGG